MGLLDGFVSDDHSACRRYGYSVLNITQEDCDVRIEAARLGRRALLNAAGFRGHLKVAATWVG
jgi:hypothetical protein